jgi:hypothetical protein
MPFERYLRHPQDPSVPPSSSPSINDYAYVQSHYPSPLGSALDPLPVPTPLHFQMPHFMLDGPPTLAPGGGAEVLPAGFISSDESLASAWMANTGFTHGSQDVYVRLQSSYLSLSTHLASLIPAQNIFILAKLLTVNTLQRTRLSFPARPPSLVPSNLMCLLRVSFHPPPKFFLFNHQSLKAALSLPHGPIRFPHRRILACQYTHPPASTSYLSWVVSPLDRIRASPSVLLTCLVLS